MLRDTEEVEIVIADFIIDHSAIVHARCLVVPLFVGDVVGMLRAPALVAGALVFVIDGLELVVREEVGAQEGGVTVLHGGLVALGVVVDVALVFSSGFDVAN